MDISRNREEDIIELNKTLKRGGIIAFVTDTVWGIGCLPDKREGVNKIYEIKKRDITKPLILMSNEIENLIPYIKNVSKKAEGIMKEYFPGALTLVFDKTEKTPNIITANKDTIGIRIPNNRNFKRICEIVEGHVLATTSANLSGEAPALSYKEVKEKLNDLIDIIIENEDEKATGEPSTVAMIKENDTIIFREGKIKIQ
jgi:L-threonylcarbamoyladenylate synthase